MGLFKKRKKPGWAALKVDAGQLAFAHVVAQSAGKPRVVAWQTKTLSDGVTASALKTFVDTCELASAHCVGLLRRAEYQLLQVNAPKVPADELKQAMRWNIKDLLDFPVDEASVDVLEIPGDEANPARQRYVYAVAARQAVIRGQVQQWMVEGRAGLEALDVAETAQRNIAVRMGEPGRGMALVAFNSQGGLLTMTADDALFHARPMEVTTEQLQHPDEDHRARVYERIALDLQRSLDNFERQFPYVAVNRLLVGPCPMRGGLVDYLKTALYLQVQPFELADVFDLTAVPVLASDAAQQAQAFELLGAALREGVA